jgi:hypothetical protein
MKKQDGLFKWLFIVLLNVAPAKCYTCTIKYVESGSIVITKEKLFSQKLWIIQAIRAFFSIPIPVALPVSAYNERIATALQQPSTDSFICFGRSNVNFARGSYACHIS